MTDLIPLDAAIAAIALGHTVTQHEKSLRAIFVIDPAAIREAALREAAEELRGHGYNTAVRAILALIGEKK